LGKYYSQTLEANNKIEKKKTLVGLFAIFFFELQYFPIISLLPSLLPLNIHRHLVGWGTYLKICGKQPKKKLAINGYALLEFVKQIFL
jgi:hypothetical protein